MLTALLKRHGIQPVSFTMLYLKLCILPELNTNGVKFISADRQKLDFSKDVYLWYCKFYNS